MTVEFIGMIGASGTPGHAAPLCTSWAAGWTRLICVTSPAPMKRQGLLEE